MAHVDELTKIVLSFLHRPVMLGGMCDECGNSVWKQGKNQNESGVMQWQRKSSRRVKSVFRRRRPLECQPPMEMNQPGPLIFA